MAIATKKGKKESDTITAHMLLIDLKNPTSNIADNLINPSAISNQKNSPPSKREPAATDSHHQALRI